MNIKDKLLIAGVMAMASESLGDSGLRLYPEKHKPKEPKNKFNLNDEQKELLKTMSAKDKKKYLKDLK